MMKKLKNINNFKREEEEQEKLRDIKEGNLTRRVFAIILDLIFFIILILPTYLPTVEGDLNYGLNIESKLNQIKQIQVDSGLFFDNTEEGDKPLTQIDYVTTDLVTDENGYFTFEGSMNTFLEILYKFYYVFLDDIDEYEVLNITKNELNPWFYRNVLNIDNEERPGFDAFYIIDGNTNSLPLTLDENGKILTSNVGMKKTVVFNSVSYTRRSGSFTTSENQEYIRAAIRIFADTDYFPGSYHQACFYLRETNEYNLLYNELEDLGRYALYISVFVAWVIYFLIIPLCFKNGQTLGMKMLSLGLVNSKECQVSRLQVFIKYLFIGCEIYIGLFTFFLFYLVDLCFIVFFKRHKSLSDLIALTLVIDTKNSVWFVSRKVEQELLKQISEKTENKKTND